MSKRDKGPASGSGLNTNTSNISPQLPRNSLEKINLGQSFAEYDSLLRRSGIYVSTPALLAASDPDRSKCFFVGRRGTGKTAITLHLQSNDTRCVLLTPELFTIGHPPMPVEAFVDTHQKPFRSLILAFRRALQAVMLSAWASDHSGHSHAVPDELRNELSLGQKETFDDLVVDSVEEIFRPIVEDNENGWRSIRNRWKRNQSALSSLCDEHDGRYTLLIDRLDENWDGTDTAVVYLTALMHACLQISAEIPWARALLFLRENIFERVRAFDTEFARLETCVVGLDWTEEQLAEMVERRINLPFNTRLALGGPTWNAFFDDGERSKTMILEYCQNRPRDVLTFCSLALETALSRKRQKVSVDDLEDAKRRYSDSRLKDLGDEYQENFSQLSLVLSKFYGLGRRFTLVGLDALIQKLVDDGQVKAHCSSWIYEYRAAEQFARLLYSIGFIGYWQSGSVKYRSLGPQDTTPPPILPATDFQIHPSYWAALDLQDALVGDIQQDVEFRQAGLIQELPGARNLSEYSGDLAALETLLSTIPVGHAGAADFEEWVQSVVELCFFRSLQNLEPRSRDLNGRVVRDLVTANRALTGFWEMIRGKYGSVQVIFECKNYAKLGAEDFQQAAYYFSDAGGRFVVLVFRGTVQTSHYEHIRRISSEGRGLVLPLTERDLLVFVRQAKNGKVKEDHLQTKFDEVIRRIS